MPNFLPTFFIALTAAALVLTLLWLWQSIRHVFVHSLAADSSKAIVSPERAALLAEKQSLLIAIKDLEAERDAGKLSSDDYRELNQQYRRRAREVLQKLDAMVAPHRATAKSLLDAAGQPDARREQTPAAPLPTASAAISCKSCGAGNDTDAVFCKKCGTRLRTEALA
jgi:hypothetical protein